MFLVGWGEHIQAATELIYPAILVPTGELQAHNFRIDIPSQEQRAFEYRLISHQVQQMIEFHCNKIKRVGI